MYELTCPSCAQVVKSSFVRAGAIIDCANCTHRYRITESHVKRVATPSPRPGPVPAPTPAQQAAKRAAQNDRSMIGLSGLSDVMRRTEASQLAVPPDAPKSKTSTPMAQRIEQGGSADLNRAEQPDPQRRNRNVYLLAATVALAVGLLGGVFLLIDQMSATQEPTASETSKVDRPESDAPEQPEASSNAPNSESAARITPNG